MSRQPPNCQPPSCRTLVVGSSATLSGSADLGGFAAVLISSAVILLVVGPLAVHRLLNQMNHGSTKSWKYLLVPQNLALPTYRYSFEHRAVELLDVERRTAGCRVYNITDINQPKITMDLNSPRTCSRMYAAGASFPRETGST